MEPTREHLFKIAEQDPTVHNCIMLWRTGDCSFEDALIYAVSALAEQKKEAIDQLILQKKNAF